MKRLLLLLIAMVAAGSAMADDITLQINGAITAGSCEVDTASQTKTVEMGQALASAFSQPYAYGPWVPFELSVTHCPATASTVEAVFNGQRDPREGTAYANMGTGRGLALQVIDTKTRMYMLPGGDPAIETVDAATHSATYEFSARYIRTTDTFAAGSFETAVQVIFTYR
ncbi:type 1 fimbrial protein [Cronobacter universalis]|nr:type 1 fimbrial protein [Cronobacter universalis]